MKIYNRHIIHLLIDLNVFLTPLQSGVLCFWRRRRHKFWIAFKCCGSVAGPQEALWELVLSPHLTTRKQASFCILLWLSLHSAVYHDQKSNPSETSFSNTFELWEIQRNNEIQLTDENYTEEASGFYTISWWNWSLQSKLCIGYSHRRDSIERINHCSDYSKSFWSTSCAITHKSYGTWFLRYISNIHRFFGYFIIVKCDWDREGRRGAWGSS